MVTSDVHEKTIVLLSSFLLTALRIIPEQPVEEVGVDLSHFGLGPRAIVRIASLVKNLKVPLMIFMGSIK